MRTALAISFVVHIVGAIGLSRAGGAVAGQSDVMPMAVSIELVEHLPDTQPPMETPPSGSEAFDEPTARPLPRRPASANRPVRARRPPCETAPPSAEAASPWETPTEAAAPPAPPTEAPTAASPGLAIGAGSGSRNETQGTGLAAAPALRTESSRTTPSWERISQVVRQHVVYPTLARRRGFRGQATVTFRVIPGGMVDQLRVIESSGHDVLDAAALEAVARSVPLPISAEPTRIVIPIVFSLQ